MSVYGIQLRTRKAVRWNTKNMAVAKFWFQCADYVFESHLMTVVPLFFYLNYFILGKNFDKTRGKFLVEIKREIWQFKWLIPWAVV